MLALSEIFKNSNRYGVRLPGTDENRALARVNIANPVAIKQLAEMAGMPVSKLKTYNAGVKGTTLGISSPQYVMVPRKHAEKLRSSLASQKTAAVQPTILANNESKTSRTSNRTYKVRSGDTLSGIASRFNMTVGVCIRAIHAENSSLRRSVMVSFTIRPALLNMESHSPAE